MKDAHRPSSAPEGSGEALTFWDHLDALRSSLLRMAIAVTVLAVGAFFLKDELFAVVLAPRSSDFVTYRLLGADHFCLHLLYEVFRFVSPGLYCNERRYAVRIVGTAYLMFIVGTLVNYFLVFPLTVHFLGTYQVSPDVANMLTLQSYIDTLLGMNLVMGVVFELPVVCALMGRLGLIDSQWMGRYRRHAVVVILMVAAIITPTTDVFTLLVVSLPIWLLYEVSILIVKATEN